MLKKVICLAMIILGLYTISVSAQSETIIMNGGTIYNGYISKQSFIQKSQGEINYSSFYITIQKSDQISRKDTIICYDDLSEKWKDWAILNDKLQKKDGKSVLLLSKIEVPNFPEIFYYVLENGSQSDRCFAFYEGNIEFKMGDIKCVKKAHRDKSLLVDMDDIVNTKTNSYVGVIIEQSPGEIMKIWDRFDNTIYVVEYEEITSVSKAVFNDDYDIWNSSKYLERLHLKSGDITPYGIITDNGDGVKFLTEKREFSYSHQDILFVEKVLNKDYTPIYDILLEENTTIVNRQYPLDFVPLRENNSADNKMYYIDTNSNSNIVYLDTSYVSIETSIKDIQDIYIFKALTKQIPLDKKQKRVYQADYLCLTTFTYTQVFESDIRYERTLSMNGTTKIDFILPSPGTYFIYLKEENKCWVINFNK